jgi:DNA modification methylase
MQEYFEPAEIGLEGTPDEYVEKLVAVFREVKRVLRDDGTLWVNIGDSYATNGTYIGDYKIKHPEHKDFHTKNSERYADKRKGVRGNGIKAKDLLGIPWRVAFALQADGWYLRQDIIWAKPNPMPESVTDRCTKAHEYIFLLTKSSRYYMDMDSVREPHETMTKYPNWNLGKGDDREPCGKRMEDGFQGGMAAKAKNNNAAANWNPLGRNRRSVWTITTQPYKEAHFATFPEEIPRTCILAGSKKGDTILDPFSGAGTTGVVAEKFDRKYIGIELNPQYTKLAEDRIYNVQPLFAGLEL